MRNNSDKILGYGVLVLGIIAVIIYCATDKTIGWCGIVFLAPILLLLAVVLDAPQRWH